MKIHDFFCGTTELEIIPNEFLLERFRNWRGIELNATDWTQLSDAPVNAVAFAVYRQELRDLPKVKDFANAELPIRPE